MPRPRAAMRQIREVLRLAQAKSLSPTEIAIAAHLPRTTVRNYLSRAAAAGLCCPAPLGPRNPNTSPRPTSNETSSNATRPPKCLARWWTESAGALTSSAGGAPLHDLMRPPWSKRLARSGTSDGNGNYQEGWRVIGPVMYQGTNHTMAASWSGREDLGRDNKLASDRPSAVARARDLEPVNECRNGRGSPPPH